LKSVFITITGPNDAVGVETKGPSTVVSNAPSKTKGREDEAVEAAEQRRLWAMAATSAAHLIAEFTDKPLPDLDAIKIAFTPASTCQFIKLFFCTSMY